MKKLVLSLSVLFAVAMVSCGGHDKKEECKDSACADTAVVEEAAEVVVDSPAVADSAAPEAPAETPAENAQ